jgi:hypothetical protein
VAIVEQRKVRYDSYEISWTSQEIDRLLRDDAERQLKEAGIPLPSGGLTFLQHVTDHEIIPLAEHGSGEPTKWRGRMKITLKADDSAPLLAPGQGGR